MRSLRIAERRDNLIRLEGIPGWLAIGNLNPCGRCGGTRFRRDRQWGWHCTVCKLRRCPATGPEIDVIELRRQVELASPKRAQ